MLTPWKESYDQPRQHIQKQRHYFVNKGPSSQGYGFSTGHVWMWELDYKENWAPKNWCSWIVVLEKTLESPLDCKEIQWVHPKGDQSWVFIGRTDAETPIFWSPDAKSWLIWKDPDVGKDWRQEEKGMTEVEMVGRHHWLNGQEFEQAPGVGDGQGSLACCSPWDRQELDTTEWLNRTEPVLTQTALLWIISSGSALLPSIGMQKDEGLQSCCFCPFVGRRATSVAQMVKNLPAMQETQAWSLGWGDPLEKGIATHSNILAWRIP